MGIFGAGDLSLNFKIHIMYPKNLSFLLLLPCFLYSQNDTPAFIRDSLDIYVDRALKDWQIPGCAVAIIKNGKIILAKGYGVRDNESKLPVDEHSLFMIASNTKEVTGITMAKLELDKKLSLDDKVTKWLPWFNLYDPNATAMVTIKDMLSHRIGFETFQGDFCHWGTNTSRTEVIRRMAKVKPIYQFRDTWGYCNAGYVVAGEILEKATGVKWEDYVTTNYFKPMDMTETLPLSVQFKSTGNYCTPHTIYKNKLIRLELPNIDNLAPAASICSSISDWAKWVQMLLNDGKWNDREIIPQRAIQMSMRAVSNRGTFRPYFNTGHFNLYGLGWNLLDYEGKKIALHTGGADGFVSSVSLIPEEKLGIIIFTNTDANNFYQALKWEIIDAYLGLPYRNYSALMLPGFKEMLKERNDWYNSVQDSIKNALPTGVPLKAFEGNYLNELYGTMKIAQEGNHLKASFEHHPNQFATLEYMGNNRFLCTYSNPLLGIKVFPFVIQNKKVKSVTVSCDDFVEFTTYEFEHK